MKSLMSLLAVLSVGCAGKFKAAAPIQIENNKVVASGYDDAWSKSVKFFATKNIPIKNLDKASGLITTDEMPFNSADDRAVFNCDQHVIMGTEFPYSGKAVFNVLIEKGTTSKSTNITITTSANYLFTGIGGGSQIKEVKKCYSTGAIEKEYFSFIQK